MNLPYLTDEKILGLAYKAFKEGIAGRDLYELLDFLEAAALKQIQECTDYREAQGLVIRYQQRKAVADYLRNHINELIESLGGDLEPDGNDTDPDSDNSAYQ